MIRYPRSLVLYGLWAFCSIGFSLALAGLSRESLTRLLVLGFLLAQLLALPHLGRFLPGSPPRTRFIALATLLAAVLEGFHMISKPVFDSLLVSRHTPPGLALSRYGVDLLFTVPAYVVIFWVLWLFISRHHFPFWHYVFVMGVAQMLGDGGLPYFFSAPWMLAFLPYPLSSYHAMNVLPFLAVRDRLPAGPGPSARIYLALPAVIGVYLACGAVIQVLGHSLGFR